MSLTVTRARVKEKCGIADASYDTAIDNLILEIVPVLEYSILSEALNDGATGVQATLNLAATEIVCGEFQAQRLREIGAGESVTIGDLRIEPSKLATALDLLQQGFSRITPFLRTQAYALPTRVSTATLPEAA
ncbi:MAG TPA: hypothetical protein VK934_04360 [Fimbriimonas sp.]|nr:hypothetical protein [Fimbriimonas sp.]